MDFKQRKLPREEAAQLVRVSMSSVQAYTWMFAPTYVFMRRNEKFISVKSPLDFFTPEDLAKLEPYDSVYYPPFYNLIDPFQRAGRRIRTILSLLDPEKSQELSESRGELSIPAPYEISDSVLKVLGPLWGAKSSEKSGGPFLLMLEPFFIAAFVEKLCDPLPPEMMKQARDKNFDTYEKAVLYSSWIVFLALHLSYCDPQFINDLRTSIFQKVAGGGSEALDLKIKPDATAHEMDAMVVLSYRTLKDPTQSFVESELEKQAGRLSEKLRFRLKRVAAQMANPSHTIPTIYGERGFASG